MSAGVIGICRLYITAAQVDIEAYDSGRLALSSYGRENRASIGERVYWYGLIFRFPPVELLVVNTY